MVRSFGLLGTNYLPYTVVDREPEPVDHEPYDGADLDREETLREDADRKRRAAEDWAEKHDYS